MSLGVGVIDVKCTVIEQPEQIADLLVKAAEFVPAERLCVSTDCGMLNCVTSRTTPDGGSIEQHHYINLTSPNYANPNAGNLSQAADGTITYTLSPVSNELPGTYTGALRSSLTHTCVVLLPR